MKTYDEALRNHATSASEQNLESPVRVAKVVERCPACTLEFDEMASVLHALESEAALVVIMARQLDPSNETTSLT